MNGNESMSAGGSPGDATACGASVRDVSVQDPSVLVDSVRDRMAWINERVNEAHQLAGTNSLARAICATVDEFAELLAVHYAGVEE
jgi:hypothetical protein